LDAAAQRVRHFVHEWSRSASSCRAPASSKSIKRSEQATDLVGAVSFLASEDAGFITGQTLYVNGGLTRSRGKRSSARHKCRLAANASKSLLRFSPRRVIGLNLSSKEGETRC
jgi:hypothetical protein